MFDVTARLESALGDRYAIQRELGRGGTAVVYLAHDLRHERQVAIKVLRPELASAVAGERFLRETKLTAGLTHPHILPLLDSGKADGLLFCVMPYVEGESLRGRLERKGRLSVGEAVRITLEVADALSHAHARGLLHRDIKPENILLEAGHAVVADFGIARALSEAGDERLTDTGVHVGTPAYMSPEQAAGERELSEASDVYSLGCVFYEMLAGEPPISDTTVQRMMSRKLLGQIQPLKRVRRDVPRPVDAAVTRSLATEPADRFASADELIDALRTPAGPDGRMRGQRRWLPVAAAAAIITVGALYWIGSSLDSPAITGPPGNGSPAGERTIAVLPFENLSEDPEMSYFADGLAVQLLDALIRLEPLRVAARQSSFAFRDSTLTVDEIGKRLNVGTIVDGSVRSGGDSIRVNVSLIDVATGFNLWSRTFDEELADVFSIQDAIAREIVRELRGRVLPGDSVNLDVARTRSLAAFDEYLKGIDQLRFRVPASLRSAREHFERAIDSDPDYAKAYAGLARAYYHLSNYDPTSATDVYGSRAKEYARHAIALDPLSAEAHAVLGGVFYQVDLRFDAAERELREAIRLDPTSATAHQWLGETLLVQGRLEDAVAPLERAADLDPLSPMPEVLLGLAEVAGGGPERGIARWEALLDRFPESFMASTNTGWTRLALGDGERAIEAWRTGARTYHANDASAAVQLSRGMEWLVRAQRDRSQTSAALHYWQGLPEDVTLPYWRYIAYTNLDAAAALSVLRRMKERQDPMFAWAGQSLTWADPALDLAPLAEFLEAYGIPHPQGETYGTLRAP